jgi:hypothetical protein
MPFPDLDQESRSGILVYLIRGSLVKPKFLEFWDFWDFLIF